MSRFRAGDRALLHDPANGRRENGQIRPGGLRGDQEADRRGEEDSQDQRVRQDMPKSGDGRLLAPARSPKSVFAEYTKDGMDVTEKAVAYESRGRDAGMGVDYFLNEQY